MTLFERGLFSLLHCGEGTAVCVTKRESSETEAVERDDTEELVHNIHIDLHKYPPPAAISSRVSHTHTHTHMSATSALDFSNFQTLLAAFFHRIYILTNLVTFFWINLSYGSVGP